MVSYPLVEHVDRIEAFFYAIKTAGKPHKFTYRHLAEIGFASSSERDLIPLLKDLNFIDGKSVPTDDYPRLLDKTDFSQVLREHIYTTYEELFELDTDVPNVSVNVLEGYFSRLLGTEESVSKEHMDTFLELCRLAEVASGVLDKKVEKVQKIPAKVNLSINLPNTTDEKVYETLFKHLRDLLAPQD